MIKNKQGSYLNELISYMFFSIKKSRNGLEDFFRYSELIKIMKKGSVTTFFQPVLELQTNKIVGYEALNRPPVSKFFPSTDTFYDYIGNTNQVFLFELFCRNTSLKRYSTNLKEVTNTSKSEKLLFLNIHPEVLIDSNDKLEEMIEFLKEFDLRPQQIVFELTEKKAVNDFKLLGKVLNHYRSKGFRLAIDDAGSGYNSLKALVHIKPEFIKLDRSLIHNIVHNEAQQKIVTILLNFANQSGSAIIAEGIEHEEDLLFLKQLGIHFGQGYALGKPHPKILVS